MEDKLHTENTDKKFLHKELSYILVGLAMEIHREYGCFHNERIYHRLFCEKLIREKIPFLSNPKIPVFSRETGNKIGCYVPDLLINDIIVVELKALSFNSRSHEIQLSEYTKITPYEVAYLFNFGIPQLYFKRIIFTNDRKHFLSLPK